MIVLTSKYSKLQTECKAADVKGQNEKIEQLTAEVSKLTYERDEMTVVIDELNVRILHGMVHKC